MSHDLKAIVSGNNKARFSHYRDGNFFYVVKVEDRAYSFPIPVEDAKGTTLVAEFKAITLMRSDSQSPGGQNLPAGELAPGRPGGQRFRNGKL